MAVPAVRLLMIRLLYISTLLVANTITPVPSGTLPTIFPLGAKLG